MAEIEVVKLNETYIRLNTSRSISMELNEYFSFYATNYKFMPAYKNKQWDGKIRLFRIRDFSLYTGLFGELKKFADLNGYSIESLNEIVKIDNYPMDDISAFGESLNVHSDKVKIDFHDYQLPAVKYFLDNKRSIILSPTSSGKSLIIYVACRYLLDKDLVGNILIIVPTVGLVTQLYDNFDDFSSEVSWSAEENCHQIYSGQSKKTDKKITISTWQSIINIKGDLEYDAVIVDEAHLADGNSISNILENLSSCSYRLGLTGTLKDAKCHKLQLEGLMGGAVKMVTTKELMDRDIVANLKIKAIALEYTDEEKKVKRDYAAELDFITTHPRRNRFLVNLCKALPGNTLVLFQFVEKHGMVLHELMKAQITDRPIFYIDGSISGEDRHKISAEIEKCDRCIIIASYGTTSTGVSIKRLDTLIFGSPYKSKIKVLQSIGRVLRISKYSAKAMLIDIVDDLSWKKKKNYCLKHFLERLGIYREEKFTISIDKRKI